MRSESEIRESNYHFRKAWQLFARVSPGAVTFDRDGLSVANANHPWFFMNFGFLNRRAADDSDLECRATEAVKYFAASRNRWLFTASEDWLGLSAPSVLSKVGLERKLDFSGMAAERLRPPVRAFPYNVQLRRIIDEETRMALADLNADAYGVPREWARQVVGSAVLWESALFGTLAYVGDEPASGAFVLPIDKALYVAWVATSKTQRRLGLAELVIRASLEDGRKATGIERTVLHATEDGFPVYLRMGYQSVVRFPLYGSSEKMSGEKSHFQCRVF
jgi:hypothetical protein